MYIYNDPVRPSWPRSVYKGARSAEIVDVTIQTITEYCIFPYSDPHPLLLYIMPSGLVLLTGATGYIGSHTGLVALKNGYRLRLIIRRAEQSNKLKALFKDHVNQLEFVVVPDFTKPNAFDDAIVDVDYVVHVASPMVGKGVDFKKDYVEPAVHGTLSILNAAKSTSSVRKVSIVSSILALLPPDTFVPDVKLPAVVRGMRTLSYSPYTCSSF